MGSGAAWWRDRTVSINATRAKTILHRYHDVDDDYYGLTANPYVGCSHRCVYCYATFEWKPDFHDVVDAKVNAADVVREELRVWRGSAIDPVFLSTATDPYQPIEGVLRLTKKVVEVLQSKGVPYYIFTKSATVIRDLDLHARYRDRCAIVWSLTTIDEGLKRALEPGASSARGIMKALKAFSDAGVMAGIDVDPVIPGLTDDEAMIRGLLKAARDNGAMFTYNGILRLRDDIWGRLDLILKERGLEGARQRITRLYFEEGTRVGPYRIPPRSYSDGISRAIKEYSESLGLRYGIPVGEGERVAPVDLKRTMPLTCYMQLD